MDGTRAREVGAARVLARSPDRVAAAWRRIRTAQAPSGRPPHNRLEGVVEPFLRELGAALGGAPGSPWSRTRGVLRLLPARGSGALEAEFETLEGCLEDALEVLGTSRPQRAQARAAFQEARLSARALFLRLLDPRAPVPRTPFGGLVLEHFEPSAARPQVRPASFH